MPLIEWGADQARIPYNLGWDLPGLRCRRLMLWQVADDGLDFESLRRESPLAGRIELGV